jgi:2-hydroxy-3-oxopropionate reductase
MGEALVLATKAGLDPEVVFNAIKGGLAGSTVPKRPW